MTRDKESLTHTHTIKVCGHKAVVRDTGHCPLSAQYSCPQRLGYTTSVSANRSRVIWSLGDPTTVVQSPLLGPFTRTIIAVCLLCVTSSSAVPDLPLIGGFFSSTLAETDERSSAGENKSSLFLFAPTRGPKLALYVDLCSIA